MRDKLYNAYVILGIIPDSITAAVIQGWTYTSLDDYHTWNGAQNIKMLSPGGGILEGVYNQSTGKLDMSSINKGSLNPGGQGIMTHLLNGVFPYFKYGNNVSDYTGKFERILRAPIHRLGSIRPMQIKLGF